MKFKLQHKLTLSHIIVTLLTAILLTVFSIAGYWLYANSDIAARYAGDDAVEIAEEFIFFLNGESLTPALARAFIENSGYVPIFDLMETDVERASYYADWLIITDTDGNILASNDTDRFNENNSFHQLAGIQAGMDPLKVYYEVNGDAHIGIAAFFNADNDPVGWVYYRVSEVGGFYLSPETVFSLGIILAGASVIATVISGAVSWLLARDLGSELYQIQRVSAAFAAGNLGQRIDIDGDDEIADVARQFNIMADQLEQQMIQLRKYGDKNALLAEEASALASLEERNRLARELHDAVKQQLFGLNLTAGSIRQLMDRDLDTAKGRLIQMEEQVHSILEEMDQIIKELRPVSLEKKGLPTALRELTKTWQEQNQIAVKLTIQSEYTIPLVREHTLYRIAQESLNNIANHAEATEVDVTLVYQSSLITLMVSDNGRGFDPTISRPAQSLGLMSMRERAEELGGSFDLKSTPDKGTILQVRIPFSKDQHYG